MPDLLILLMQIAAILLAARMTGALFRAIGQPQVIGEMAAGIALGPSLLGWVAPEVAGALFARESLVPLYTLSQMGLLVFMFLVGLEFDPATLRRQGHAAFLTSHVSIAWCLLAYIVALVRASDGAQPLWFTLAGLTVYILAMWAVGRRLLGGILARFRRAGRVGDDLLGLLLLLLLGSAMATEWLGVHLLFGAFFFGVVLPKEERFVEALVDRIEALATVLLLPIFFAFTGLRTSIGLIHGRDMWMLLALVLMVAVGGKLGGSALAARVSGMGWREATALGILMNTRGLMELVILSIGLDLGIISPALFSMLVVMALVTTFMTTPLLTWVIASPSGSGLTMPGRGCQPRASIP